MQKIIKKIKDIEPKIKALIKQRLNEFKDLNQKGNDEWFSELCFCILTANSRAKTAMSIQKQLGCNGFLKGDEKIVCSCIIDNKHRFHNNKTRFIIKARKFVKIKDIITDLVKEDGQKLAREWIVDNIKGIGYKEASHFLRNVGYFDLAILDRHILRLMDEEGFIKEIPKSLSKKTYLDIEEKYIGLSRKARMNAAELDLNLWYLQTGEILK